MPSSRNARHNSVGETRVDLLHLLEDLTDAYPGALEETVLTEMVANALDSGATTIALSTNTGRSTFTIVDDGVGMRRAELRRFHDVAASTKTKGDGIGFAGVGIKLGLLVSDEVITESRRGKEHVATSWMLANRKRAPWRWIAPPGLVGEHGTAVCLRLTNALSPLLDAALLETLLRRHFAPLFDARFDQILANHYPGGIRFSINERPLPLETPRVIAVHESAQISVRLARKRKPSAVGYMVRADHPLSDDEQGIAISTLGKVIKRGWEWLGLTPSGAERVGGLVEVPGLASCLTLNKADFIRSGPRGATYLAYRKALQEEIAARLAEWGDVPDDDASRRRRAARPVERDVERVLLELTRDFPMLSTLVERRPGGRRSLPAAIASADDAADGTMNLFADPERDVEPAQRAEDDVQPQPPADVPAPAVHPTVASPSSQGKQRPTRLGLSIQFDARPDDPALGRLVESTVWVNDAHPAYRRASASRAEGYHIALSVAMALASVAVEPERAQTFITEFLIRWGEPTGRGSRRRRRRS